VPVREIEKVRLRRPRRVGYGVETDVRSGEDASEFFSMESWIGSLIVTVRVIALAGVGVMESGEAVRGKA